MIEGELQWAKEVERPSFIPKGRPRGTKAVGLAYERKVAQALGPQARPGVWFEYFDEGGKKWCQVDILYPHGQMLFVVECKLSDVVGARAKLHGLYLPVVHKAYARPVRGIIVARHLTREPNLELVCEDFASALKFSGPISCKGVHDARKYAAPTLHWIGRGPI